MPVAIPNATQAHQKCHTIARHERSCAGSNAPQGRQRKRTRAFHTREPSDHRPPQSPAPDYPNKTRVHNEIQPGHRPENASASCPCHIPQKPPWPHTNGAQTGADEPNHHRDRGASQRARSESPQTPPVGASAGHQPRRQARVSRCQRRERPPTVLPAGGALYRSVLPRLRDSRRSGSNLPQFEISPDQRFSFLCASHPPPLSLNGRNPKMVVAMESGCVRAATGLEPRHSCCSTTAKNSNARTQSIVGIVGNIHPTYTKHSASPNPAGWHWAASALGLYRLPPSDAVPPSGAIWIDPERACWQGPGLTISPLHSRTAVPAVQMRTGSG